MTKIKDMTDCGFYNIRKSSILLEGVKCSHLIMHISDSHLCVYDELSSETERTHGVERETFWQKGKRHFAGMDKTIVTAENDFDTRTSFEKILDFAEKIQPELLVISGDTLENMSEAGKRYLKSRLTSYRGRYLCVPGNHEDMSLEGLWNSEPAVYRGEGFTFVGFDNRRKTVSDGSLEVLKNLLDEGTPLFPVYHVPLSTDSNRADLSSFEEYYFLDEKTENKNGSEFVKLITGSPVVKACFCGHVHIFTQTEVAPGKMQISAASSMVGNIHLIEIHG